MALRHEKGKLRPQPTRLKDVAARKRGANGAGNHGPGGRFAAGNKAAHGKRVKAIIKRHLGRDASGAEAETLYREVRDIFQALVRATGSNAPQVQDTLARRARWGVLSAWFALRAVDVGLETEQGQAYIELALKLDQRAERLDVTALDLANRLDDGAAPARSLADQIGDAVDAQLADAGTKEGSTDGD